MCPLLASDRSDIERLVDERLRSLLAGGARSSFAPRSLAETAIRPTGTAGPFLVDDGRLATWSEAPTAADDIPVWDGSSWVMTPISDAVDADIELVIRDSTALEARLSLKSEVGHKHGVGDLTSSEGTPAEAVAAWDPTQGKWVPERLSALDSLNVLLTTKSDAAHVHQLGDLRGADTMPPGSLVVWDRSQGRFVARAVAAVDGVELLLAGKSDVGHLHRLGDLRGDETLAKDALVVWDRAQGRLVAKPATAIDSIDALLATKSEAGHPHRLGDLRGDELVQREALAVWDATQSRWVPRVVTALDSMDAVLARKSDVGHPHRLGDLRADEMVPKDAVPAWDPAQARFVPKALSGIDAIDVLLAGKSDVGRLPRLGDIRGDEMTPEDGILVWDDVQGRFVAKHVTAIDSVDALLAGKSDLGHAHLVGDLRGDVMVPKDAIPTWDQTQARFVPRSASAIDALDVLFAGKSDKGHNHDFRYSDAGLYIASIGVANSGTPTHNNSGANQKVGSGGGVTTWTSLIDRRPPGAISQVDTAGGRILCQREGYYLILATISFVTLQDNTDYSALAYVNGAQQASDFRGAAVGLAPGLMDTNAFRLISLNEGDIVELYAFQNDSGSEAYRVTSNYFNSISIIYLAAL